VLDAPEAQHGDAEQGGALARGGHEKPRRGEHVPERDGSEEPGHGDAVVERDVGGAGRLGLGAGVAAQRRDV